MGLEGVEKIFWLVQIHEKTTKLIKYRQWVVSHIATLKKKERDLPEKIVGLTDSFKDSWNIFILPQSVKDLRKKASGAKIFTKKNSQK